MITEAINILAKREDLYNCLLKAEIFQELERDYPTLKLAELIVDRKNGTWGEDFLKDGYKVKVLRSQDIRHGFINYENAEVRYVSEVDLEKNQLEGGDILVIKSNGSEDLVGKSQIFYSNKIDIVIPSNFLMRIRPNQDLILPNYLDLFLKSPQALKWRVDKQSTTTGLRNLDTDGFLSVDVPLPTLEEQEMIVNNYNSFLREDFSGSTVFDISRIDKFRNLCYVLNNLSIEFEQEQTYFQLLRQTILQEAVQGKLSEPGFIGLNDFAEEKKRYGKLWNAPATELLAHIKAEKEKSAKSNKSKASAVQTITPDEIPFELPEGWIWCRLGEITNFLNGDRGKNYPNQHEYVPEGIAWINTGHIEPDGTLSKTSMHFISESKYHSLRGGKISKGDLVYCLRGATIGKTAFTEQFELGAIASSLIIIRAHESINRWFLYFYLTSPLGRAEIKKFDNGSAQPNLSANNVERYFFPLPPLAEQHRIVAKVQSLQQQLSQLEAQVQQSRKYAQQLLQSVLKEAFESKGKVYEMEEEVSMVAESEVAYSNLVKLDIPKKETGFAKQVLAGKIVSLFKEDKNFTHIKFQKLQFLAEHIAEADVNLNYYFQTAGPYDNRFMHTIAHSFKKSKWFDEQQYKFIPLEKQEQIEGYYQGYFGPVSHQLNKLFDLLANATVAETEIIATLYAVWNNRILLKQSTEENLLIQDFYNWSDRKHRYSEDQILEGLHWLKQNNFEPRGFGKEIKRVKDYKVS